MENLSTPLGTLYKPSLSSNGFWRVRLYLGRYNNVAKEKVFYGNSPEQAWEKGLKYCALHEKPATYVVTPQMNFYTIPPEYRRLYSRSKTRARVRGISFDLSQDDFARIVKKADGYCMYSHVPFDLTPHGHLKSTPFSPSLDRINSAQGYSATNCRLICQFLNLAFGTWGDYPITMLLERYRRRWEEETGVVG